MNLSFFKTKGGILTLGILVIALIAIPITVYLVGQQQNLRQSAAAIPGTPSGYYPPLGGSQSDATGNVLYLRAGLAFPEVPTPFFSGAWHFPTYHITDGSVPAGFVDGASTDVGNEARLIVAGPGTMTIYTRAINDTTHRFIDATLHHHVAGGNTTTDQSQLAITPGTNITFNVPNDGVCYHWVDVQFNSDKVAAGLTGFGGFNWLSTGSSTCGGTQVPTDTPTPTQTPIPTATLTPTATSVPTPTNTPTPRPTNVPTPTNTPIPTATSIPAPTNTPVPGVTVTVIPTDTPIPGAIATPTPTPGPTNTPVPGATDTPTPIQSTVIVQNPTLLPAGPSTTLINIGILGIIIAIVGGLLLLGL